MFTRRESGDHEATEDTSCTFAKNVRTARGLRPGNPVTAFSPVTQQSYMMQCSPTVTNTWPVAQRCAGSNSYGVSLIVFTATPAGGSRPTGTQSTPQQSGVGVGIGVGVGADSPKASLPNIGCTWVNGYTKKNGTHVSGYWRC